MKQKSELKVYLEQKLEDYKQKNLEDYKSLLGSLMEWGSAVPFQGTLGEGIESQIEYQSQRKSISPKEFIDFLFGQKDYDAWMLAFQS